MATGTYKVNPTATVANYGENSAPTKTLQTAINAVSPTKIAVDSKYGDQTKGAYDSLVGQGYTYANGAFTKPTPVVDTTKTTPTKDASSPRPIYDNEPTVTNAQSVDEIQSNKLKLAQAEIDALGAYYQGLKNEQIVINDKNNRSTSSISALTGLSGSTEANVAEQETTGKGNKALAQIEAEKQMKIQVLLGNIRESAVTEARQQRLDARQSEQDRISYREKAQQDAVTHLTTLAHSESGATLEGLKTVLAPNEYDYLIKNAGGETMAKAILFKNRPQNTLVGSPVNVGGHMVQYFKTPTGEVKSETVPLPAGVSPDAKLQKIGNTLYSSNDGGNTWKAITSKSGGTSSGTTVKSGNAVFSSEKISEFSATLENSRGADKYVDPTVYQQAYDAWVDPKVGGLAKDFLAKYPPKKYVNPANTTLPAYLRSSTAKATTGRGI